MAFVYVVDVNGQVLMPTKRFGKVRRLLKHNLAQVVRHQPFTIQLQYETTDFVQDLTLGVDAGSRHVGLSVTSEKQEYYASEVELRDDIPKLLKSRAELRRSRRNRKTRYRKARFDNRVSTKPKGWLAPSIEHKVETHLKLIDKVHSFLPIKRIIIEVASFDTQKMVKPEISGIEYQQGTLQGYHVREYLLEKFNRKCAYCGVKDIPLEIEHLVPRSRGGSNRVDNLALACRSCNLAKGNKTAVEYGYPRLMKKASQSLKHAAHMNLIRWAVYNRLVERYEDVSLTYGYMTKKVRIESDLPKSHVVDARCITGNPLATPLDEWWLMKKIRRHNRSLHKLTIYKGGVRRNNQTPYMTRGFRRFDKVEVKGREWYINGRRLKGAFVLKNLEGETLNITPTKIKLIREQHGYIVERRRLLPS